MYVLGIETTGPKGSVAILDLGKKKNEGGEYEVAMRTCDEPMGHLKNLMAMAEELLRSESAAPRDICAVAVSQGPGSYTGIRIGAASARAIAQALDVPLIPVGSLDQFRQTARAEDRRVAVIFNARRGQVYGAVFERSGEEVCDILAPGPYMLTDVLALTEPVKDRVIFYGDGADAYADQLEGYCIAPEERRYPTAELTLTAAMAALEEEDREKGREAGCESLWDYSVCVPYNEMDPVYMRETEAEQKLKDGSLARAREAKMAKFRSR